MYTQIILSFPLRQELCRFPKTRLKLKKRVKDVKTTTKDSNGDKENFTPSTPTITNKQPVHTYSLRKTGKKTVGDTLSVCLTRLYLRVCIFYV